MSNDCSIGTITSTTCWITTRKKIAGIFQCRFTLIEGHYTTKPLIPAAESGPVVITLSAPTLGESKGYVDISKDLTKEMAMNPSGCYLNVDNLAYSGKGLRGYLK